MVLIKNEELIRKQQIDARMEIIKILISVSCQQGDIVRYKDLLAEERKLDLEYLDLM